MLVNGVALMNILVLSAIVLSIVAFFLAGALVDHVMHDGLAVRGLTFMRA
jgi:hypothetical protein